MVNAGTLAVAADEAPVEAHLDALLGALPESLVGRVERNELRLAAQPFCSLPGEAVVELHLGGLSQRDLTARLWPIGAQRLLAEGRRGTRNVPESTLRFLSEWLRSEGALARVPYVELEQDIVDGEPHQWVGPAIRPDFRHGGGVPETNDDVFDTGVAVLRELPDWPLPLGLVERFRRFVDALPASARLNMMSSLGARAYLPRPGLRLIASAPPDVALDLAALDGRNHERAARLLARHAAPHIGFDLELTADGLANYFAFYRRFSNPRWSDGDLRVFLDHTLGDGLLTHHELRGFRELATAIYHGHLALTFKLVLRDSSAVRLKAYVERLVY